MVTINLLAGNTNYEFDVALSGATKWRIIKNLFTKYVVAW
jgi:hypothetical protein